MELGKEAKMNSSNAAVNRIIDCASQPEARFLELAEALYNFRKTFISEDGRQLGQKKWVLDYAEVCGKVHKS